MSTEPVEEVSQPDFTNWTQAQLTEYMNEQYQMARKYQDEEVRAQNEILRRQAHIYVQDINDDMVDLVNAINTCCDIRTILTRISYSLTMIDRTVGGIRK